MAERMASDRGSGSLVQSCLGICLGELGLAATQLTETGRALPGAAVRRCGGAATSRAVRLASQSRAVRLELDWRRGQAVHAFQQDLLVS